MSIHSATRQEKPAASAVTTQSTLSQRKCACGAAPGLDDSCAKCREEKLQRGPQSGRVPPALQERRDRVEAAVGQRKRQPPGHDFGQMPVYADAKAGSARDEAPGAAGPGKHGPRGFAVCKPGSGKYVAVVKNELCYGDCVAQHEQVHVEDMSPCCARYGACFNSNDMSGRDRCREAWEKYESRTEHWSECNAYTLEFDCLWGLLLDYCQWDSDGTVSPECCEELDKQHAFVTDMIMHHCPKSLQPPCPFDENGKIILNI